MSEESHSVELGIRPPEEVPSDRTLERFGLTRVPGFVVEIGYGDHPIPLSGNLRFGKYAGFDQTYNDSESKHPEYADTVRRILTRFRDDAKRLRPGEDISFGYGDAVKDEVQGREGLPLDDNIADEVYIADVLNGLSQEMDNDERQREQRDILNEARRVLAPDGRLVIKVSWWDHPGKDLPLDDLRQLLVDTGFEAIDACRDSEEEYSELEKRYGRTTSAHGFEGFSEDEPKDTSNEDRPYFIVAKKIDPLEEGSLLP